MEAIELRGAAGIVGRGMIGDDWGQVMTASVNASNQRQKLYPYTTQKAFSACSLAHDLPTDPHIPPDRYYRYFV